MEFQRNQTVTYQSANPLGITNIAADSDHTNARLNALLAANLEIAREKERFATVQERFEASLMKSPLSPEKAYSYFGAMLGLFPPFAIFSKFIFESYKMPEAGLVVLLLLVNAICAVVGYFSGKLIGKIVFNLEKLSWTKMILALPFIGIFWRIMTGGAGGLLIFVIGAIFGAFIASMVGSIALPAFTIFHRLLKKGDLIEEKHFFPLALGVTGVITAFILSLPIR